MIAVLFEAKAEPAYQARYLQLAAELKPLLADIDGFIDIERFQSLTTDGKILSLSWWRDEEAVRRWTQNVFHQAARRFFLSTVFAWRNWCGNTVPKPEGTRMYDVHVIFSDRPGELASFGQLLGRNGVGLEGGGVFGTDAHFLVEDGEKARRVLLDAGFTVQALRKPVIRKLKQERPGELGEIAAALAARGVSILTQYSDHANHLILLTDDDKLAAEITTPWATNVKDELTL